MAPSQRQQRRVDPKHSSTNSAQNPSSNNSNIWIIAVVFAALILYVLYQSISIYNNDRMYNDFE